MAMSSIAVKTTTEHDAYTMAIVSFAQATFGHLDAAPQHDVTSDTLTKRDVTLDAATQPVVASDTVTKPDVTSDTMTLHDVMSDAVPLPDLALLPAAAPQTVQTDKPTATEPNLTSHINDKETTTPSTEQPEKTTQPKKRTQKRKREPENWKKNVMSRKCNAGEEYINSKGQQIKAKTMGPGCGVKCKFNCHGQFSEETRHKIFASFWQMAGPTDRRYYAMRYISRREVARKTSKLEHSRRKHSLLYTLPQKGVEIPVCKVFFLHTLAITDKLIFTAIMKTDEQGVMGADRRGRHGKQRCISEGQKEEVRKHITSFPTVESSSHNCPTSKSRQYLDPHLSVTKMHLFYSLECQKKGIPAVKLHLYRTIFNTEFNFGFQTPKKLTTSAPRT